MFYPTVFELILQKYASAVKYLVPTISYNVKTINLFLNSITIEVVHYLKFIYPLSA